MDAEPHTVVPGHLVSTESTTTKRALVPSTLTTMSTRKPSPCPFSRTTTTACSASGWFAPAGWPLSANRRASSTLDAAILFWNPFWKPSVLLKLNAATMLKVSGRKPYLVDTCAAVGTDPFWICVRSAVCLVASGVSPYPTRMDFCLDKK